MPRQPKKTVEQVAKLLAEATAFMQKFGIRLVVEPDADLAALKRGKPLTAGELRAMPDGAVVYVVCYEADEYARSGRSLRMKGAYRITKRTGDEQDEDVWGLDDGSSFAGEICVAGLSDDSEAYDVGAAEDGGDLRLYHVRVPKAPKAP